MIMLRKKLYNKVQRHICVFIDHHVATVGISSYIFIMGRRIQVYSLPLTNIELIYMQ